MCHLNKDRMTLTRSQESVFQFFPLCFTYFFKGAQYGLRASSNSRSRQNMKAKILIFTQNHHSPEHVTNIKVLR